MKRAIAVPEGLHRRELQGQLLYSHVVIAEGRRMVFVSGQLARSSDGQIVGRGDMRAQIRQVCENLKTALAAAGAGLNDVVETTTYTTDIEEYFRHVDVRMEFFRGDLPTSTTVQVSRLSHLDFLVEIKATAVL